MNARIKHLKIVGAVSHINGTSTVSCHQIGKGSQLVSAHAVCIVNKLMTEFRKVSIISHTLNA